MFRPLSVALLLVLAGCNVPTAEPAPTESVTAAPVPAVPETATPEGQLVPGVFADGVAGGRLGNVHGEALEGVSYTVNQTLLQRYANGTVRSRYVTVARFAADPSRFRTTLRQADREDGRLVTRTVSRYGDGERAYEAVTEANTTRYGVVRWPDGEPREASAIYPGNLTNDRSIARVFTLVETRPVEEFEANGTRYVRLRSVPNATLPPLSNVTVTAVVSEEGLVRSYRVSYDVSRTEGSVRTTVALSYTRVGETVVVEPPWLDRARNASAT